MKKELNRYRPAGLDETLTDQYGIEVYYSTKDLKAIFYAGKSSKKWWFYRFFSLDDMIRRIYASVDNHVKRENEKLYKRAELKKAMQIFKAADYFAPGDIVVNTWGYEQTNVDFYQVTEVLNKKIRVCKIAGKIVKATGPMSADVMPVKDSFCDDTDRRNISLLSLKAQINSKGDVSCRICNPESFYYFRKWDGRPQYCSWYA